MTPPGDPVTLVLQAVGQHLRAHCTREEVHVEGHRLRREPCAACRSLGEVLATLTTEPACAPDVQEPR